MFVQFKKMTNVIIYILVRSKGNAFSSFSRKTRGLVLIWGTLPESRNSIPGNNGTLQNNGGEVEGEPGQTAPLLPDEEATLAKSAPGSPLQGLAASFFPDAEAVFPAAEAAFPEPEASHEDPPCSPGPGEDSDARERGLLGEEAEEKEEEEEKDDTSLKRGLR